MANKYTVYVKNLSIYFGASLIPMILTLVSNPWIAKNMSPEDYAVSGYYTSFNSLISPIIWFYLIQFYIKEYFNINEIERRRLLVVIAQSLVWFSGLVSVLCFFSLLFYIKYLKPGNEMTISPYLAFSVFAIPLSGLYNLKLAQYRIKKKASSYFLLSVLNGVVGVLCTVLFVVIFHWGAFGKLLGPLICNFAVFICMLILFSEELKSKFDFNEFKKVFVFCLPLAASAMLGYFTNGFSTTYLESVGNATEYGVYVVGASIGAYLSVFATAIGNTFQPDIFESIVKKQWRRYIKLCILKISLIALVAICFIIAAPFIISILTANRYVDSSPYAQIIAISTISYAIYLLINDFSIATNRPKIYLYTSVLGSLFIIICMPIAVSKWTYFGGAWMNVLSYVAFSLISLMFLLASKIRILPKCLQ